MKVTCLFYPINTIPNPTLVYWVVSISCWVQYVIGHRLVVVTEFIYLCLGFFYIFAEGLSWFKGSIFSLLQRNFCFVGIFIDGFLWRSIQCLGLQWWPLLIVWNRKVSYLRNSHDRGQQNTNKPYTPFSTTFETTSNLWLNTSYPCYSTRLIYVEYMVGDDNIW